MSKRVSQIAFDSVETLGKLTSIDEILAELRRIGDQFGYDNFCISGLPSPTESVEPYVMVSGWPEDWMTRYVANDYVHHDPVIRQVRTSTMPFMWNEAPVDSSDALARQVLNESPAFGLCNGFAVPIYSLHGFQAIVTFGGANVDLSKDDKAALHLIAIYAHSAARTIHVSGNARNTRRPRLSDREIECLKWSAAGKTAWETSSILSLSQRTVEQYLASAAFKLGAVTRTQAVAEALRRRVIP